MLAARIHLFTATHEHVAHFLGIGESSGHPHYILWLDFMNFYF